MPKAAKAALWFTCCGFLLKGLGFITGPIFTRLLPPEEYGLVTLYVTYEQIILILATWEIHVGAYQRGLFKFEGSHDQYSQSTLLLVNLLTILFFGVIALFYRPVSDFTQMSSLTWTLMFFYVMTNPAYMCWMTRKRKQYDYKAVVPLTIFTSVSSIVVAIVAILVVGHTGKVRFNSLILYSTLIYLYFYIKTLFPKGVKPKWKEMKAQWAFMLAYEAPLVLHSLSYLVLGQADRVMIGKMVGNSEAAFYGVAYTLASTVTLLQSSINEALVPWRYEKLREGSYEKVGKTTNMLLILFGAAILGIVLIAPEIMKLLFPSSYYEAVWCIPPVTISIFFMFLYSSFVAVESYYEKTKYIMYVSVFCGLVNIGLNYLLIPLFGYVICGYTTLFSYILFAVLHYFCMRIVCKNAISGAKIFSMSTIVVISIGVILCSVLFTLLYPFWIARLAIIVTMLVVGWIKKALIIEIFSIMKKRS